MDGNDAPLAHSGGMDLISELNSLREGYESRKWGVINSYLEGGAALLEDRSNLISLKSYTESEEFQRLPEYVKAAVLSSTEAPSLEVVWGVLTRDILDDEVTIQLHLPMYYDRRQEPKTLMESLYEFHANRVHGLGTHSSSKDGKVVLEIPTKLNIFPMVEGRLIRSLEGTPELFEEAALQYEIWVDRANVIMVPRDVKSPKPSASRGYFVDSKGHVHFTREGLDRAEGGYKDK